MKNNYFKSTMKIAVLVSSAFIFSETKAQTVTTTYSSTGSMQTYTVPACVTQITVDAMGAEGGDAIGTTTGWGAGPVNLTGGNGGRVLTVITVTPGEVLNIFVGAKGTPTAGGFNGGGNPGPACSGTEVKWAGGGGASDIRRNGITLADRIIVAGGGGGAAGASGNTYRSPDNSGGGGGLNGSNGTNSAGNACVSPAGGTQGAGGIGGNQSCWCGGPLVAGTGSLGLGGNSLCAPSGLSTCSCGGTGCTSGGGGGGGYYGGGAGICFAGGAGGSSYTLPAAISVIHTQGFQTGNGLILITSGIGAASIAASSTSVCAGSPVTFTASGATTYTWSTGSNSTIISVTPSVSTTYSLSAIFTSTAGSCSSTAAVNVTVNPSPTIAVSGSTLICGTGTNILTASGANTYSWSTGAITASISASPSVTTNYTVIGTNTVGGCTSTQTLSLVVSTNPTVAVAGAVVICNGQTTTLTASGANTYSWNNGAVTAAVALSPTATTAYTVVGTNTAGCAGANMQTVTVNPSPTVSVVGGQTICVGVQSASLSASGANTYSWSNGATTASIVVSPTVTITYTAIGTSSVNGCTGMNTAIVTVDPCTGLSNQSAALNGLSLYPNPGNGDFTIELKNGLSKTIEVTDYTGKLVFTSTSSKDIINVNLSSLANGIYNVKVQSNNTTQILKVVKQ